MYLIHFSDALSGYIRTPKDEAIFAEVAQNWLKHAPLPKSKHDGQIK